MGRSRYHFIHPDQPHFMTLTVQGWLPVFTRPESVQILLNAFGFLMSENLRIHAWVILENHLHLIAQSPRRNRNLAWAGLDPGRQDLRERALPDWLAPFSDVL